MYKIVLRRRENFKEIYTTSPRIPNYDFFYVSEIDEELSVWSSNKEAKVWSRQQEATKKKKQ